MSKFPAFNADMSIAALTAIYNGLVDKPIAKFSDKKQAIARLEKLAAEFKPAKTKRVRQTGLTIGGLVAELSAEGVARSEILSRMMETFPNAVFAGNVKLASKHLSWHVSKAKKLAA
jgi:hypothetical protein